MNKILLAFDGSHFSEGAFEFARRINEKQSILLTGVFLPLVNYASLSSYANASGSPIAMPLLEDDNSEAVQRNIQRFENLCKQNNIEYRVHRDFTDFALPGIKKETRFADLIILGSETFYQNAGTGEPNEYLKDALHVAESAVLIVPENFSFPESNVLAFDGSESSVYAIKQFSYLFPELSNNKTFLVYASEGNKPFPDEGYMKELITAHFADVSIQKLDINPKKDFATWISERKSPILVSGSFGRAFVSELFKRSFVSDVLREHKIPVFITHR